MSDEVDFYFPSDANTPLPAVVIVGGYPGRMNTLELIIKTARRIADAGMIGVAYANDEPVAGLQRALEKVRAREGVDADRIAFWATSGNVPLALSALHGIRCAALLYGFMLDVPETNFGFVDPKTRFEDVPRDVPLFLVRAGRDHFDGLNASIDRFVAQSLANNLPITLVNLPEAQHGSEAADSAVLRFLQLHLSAVSPEIPRLRAG
ncbi:MAG: hypothetical protein DMF56_00600 [Acidobacteria bacterium]|nr:MAG: hypothetical protein DMF56_00600 [Acidobacteriota bacterium]